MSEDVISREIYFTARNGLQALVEERERLFREGTELEDLRGWLEAGVADRWLELEAVIQRARAADFALAMWWEHEWRWALKKTQRTERKRQRKAQRDIEGAGAAAGQAAPATAPAAGSPAPRPTAPGPMKKREGRAAHGAGEQGPRRFEPSGTVWRA